MRVWLNSPGGYWTAAVAIMAAALCVHAPALFAGYLLDDYAQLAMLEGDYPASRAAWELYTFSTGDPDEGERLINAGVYPWWADPRVRLSMFRPLASLTLALDHHLFGRRPLLGHLHSLAYLCGLLVATAALLRRLLPAPVALLALLLFGFDQAHPVTLGWLANRTALISALFAVLSLSFYLRFREHGARQAQVLSGLCMTISLASGEYGMCAVGYFLAFECLGRTDSMRVRMTSVLATIGAPALAYLAARQLIGGGGPQYSGVYLDPLSAPAAFAHAAISRYPALVADALLGMQAEFWSFGSPWTPVLIELGVLPDAASAQLAPYRRLHEGCGWAALAGCVGGIGWLGRQPGTGHERTGAWLGAGGLLAVLPVVGSLPGSRLLLLPGLGVAVLLATVIGKLWGASGPATRVGALVLLALHGVAEPASAHRQARAWATLPDRVRRAIVEAPLGGPGAHSVLVSSADPSLLIYMGAIKRAAHRPSPGRIWALSGNRHPLRLTRTGPASLEVSYPKGRGMLGSPFERMFRGPGAPLLAGRQLRLDGMTATVLRTASFGGGAKVPTAIRFVFDRRLSDPGFQLVVPTREGIRPLPVPAPGRFVELRAPVVPVGG